MPALDANLPSPQLARTDKWRAKYALACSLGNEVAEKARTERGAAAPTTDALPEALEAESLLRDLVFELVDARDDNATAVEQQLAESMARPALLLLAGIFALTPKSEDPATEPLHLTAFRSMAGVSRSPRDLTERDNIQRLLDDRDDGGIIRFIGLSHMMSSTDAAYAGACYFALQASDPVGGPAASEMATDLLGFAITSPSLKTWAPDDPVLEPLRNSDAWRALFAEASTDPASDETGPASRSLSDRLRAAFKALFGRRRRG